MPHHEPTDALSDAHQATAGQSRKEGMSDLNYDLITSLAETLSAVDVANSYIEDARQAGDQHAVQAFTQIREDQLRHCDMLRKIIEDRVKRGDFD